MLALSWYKIAIHTILTHIDTVMKFVCIRACRAFVLYSLRRSELFTYHIVREHSHSLRLLIVIHTIFQQECILYNIQYELSLTMETNEPPSKEMHTPNDHPNSP